jgi:hypothetical protein
MIAKAFTPETGAKSFAIMVGAAARAQPESVLVWSA